MTALAAQCEDAGPLLRQVLPSVREGYDLRQLDDNTLQDVVMTGGGAIHFSDKLYRCEYEIRCEGGRGSAGH